MSFSTYWYLHVPSLVLAALIYLLVLRGLVAAVFGWQPASLPGRILARTTDPMLGFAAALAPRAVPRAGVWVFAVFWMFVLLLISVYALSIPRARPLWH
ncbi:MAG: hypothetical protein NW223_05230 [Hyphomicrobiaceae bacterium]|nr:hypothetical protein [Hyphomicrobiaceae bacterium]